MTPEEQVGTYKAIENSAVVMAVAELRLIRQAAQVATVLFLLFLLMILGAVIANATPIEALPLPTQYWYTTDIPTPEGVLPVEVYAPALPRIVAADLVPIIEIGDPPRLVDVPEPGTAWFVLGFCIVCLCILIVQWLWAFWKGFVGAAIESQRKHIAALTRIADTSRDEVSREIAREALEEE